MWRNSHNTLSNGIWAKYIRWSWDQLKPIAPNKESVLQPRETQSIPYTTHEMWVEPGEADVCLSHYDMTVTHHSGLQQYFFYIALS